MIHIDKGELSIVGIAIDVKSELSTLIHHLFFKVLLEDAGLPYDVAKNFIQDAVKFGLMTQEELDREFDRRMREHGETD